MQPPMLLILFDSLCSAVDFPGCLAMASPSTLTIGLIDEVQRLHVSNSFSFSRSGMPDCCTGPYLPSR